MQPTNTIAKNETYQLSVHTLKGTYFFKLAEIVRLEASSNYTCIHFTNRRPIIIAKVLGDYELALSAFGFVRTHRSHLVNKSFIRFVDNIGNIFMQDESKVEISRRKKSKVMKLLKAA
jgi:two-component system LytT family response regulator